MEEKAWRRGRAFGACRNPFRTRRRIPGSHRTRGRQEGCGARICAVKQAPAGEPPRPPVVCVESGQARSVGTAPQGRHGGCGCRSGSGPVRLRSALFCHGHAHRITSSVEGNTMLGGVASASRALAVGNAEQAASRSKAADPGVCHQRVESRPADKTLSIKWEYSGQAKFTFGPCKPEHISLVSPYIASVL